MVRRSDELTAYHEAGHAVVAVHLGGRIKVLSIEPEPEKGRDGHVWLPLEISLDVSGEQMVQALVEQAEKIVRVADQVG